MGKLLLFFYFFFLSAVSSKNLFLIWFKHMWKNCFLPVQLGSFSSSVFFFLFLHYFHRFLHFTIQPPIPYIYVNILSLFLSAPLVLYLCLLASDLLLLSPPLSAFVWRFMRGF